MEVVFESNIHELELMAQDASRDIYALPQEKLLIVHTDRITVEGYELDKPIPFRGVVLNQITLYWMQKFSHMASHNIVTPNVKRFPPELRPYEKMLTGRSVIVQKLKSLPLFFRVVGSLAGNDWKTYKETGRLGNRILPKTMRESDRLETPVLLVTPSEDLSKLDVDDMTKWAQRMYGQKLYSTIEDICLSVFGVARNYAGARGLTIADAAFEFAIFDGNPYFINQLMTQETATYWSSETFARGKPQPSFEKQYIDEWHKNEGWKDGQMLPPLGQDVVDDTTKRCRTIFNIMTGKVAKSDSDGSE